MPTTANEIAASVSPKKLPVYEQELDDAFDRVYAKYGPNLTAFFDDVRKSREEQAAQRAPAASTTTKHR